MDSLIIESSNFLFMIIGAFAVWRVVCWKLDGHLSEHNRDIVHAWVWVFGAASLNHSWFAMSRHLSEPGERWHAGMLEWRWAAVLLTSLAFSWGMTSFVRHIEGFGYQKQAIIFGLSFVAAYGIGYF